MIKKIFIVTVASVMLASCGCSGWSCKKRYVDHTKKPDDKVRNA
jgi:hypothetical protein